MALRRVPSLQSTCLAQTPAERRRREAWRPVFPTDEGSREPKQPGPGSGAPRQLPGPIDGSPQPLKSLSPWQVRHCSWLLSSDRSLPVTPPWPERLPGCPCSQTVSWGPHVGRPSFVYTNLNSRLQMLTCVSAFNTLILWVEMKRSTSVRVWASPSEL